MLIVLAVVYVSDLIVGSVECLSMHDSGSYVVGAIVCASGDSGCVLCP